MFRIESPKPFVKQRIVIHDGGKETVNETTSYQLAEMWLEGLAGENFELVSPVIVRGNDVRCSLSSTTEGGALVFRHVAPKGRKS